MMAKELHDMTYEELTEYEQTVQTELKRKRDANRIDAAKLALDLESAHDVDLYASKYSDELAEVRICFRADFEKARKIIEEGRK